MVGILIFLQLQISMLTNLISAGNTSSLQIFVNVPQVSSKHIKKAPPHVIESKQHVEPRTEATRIEPKAKVTTHVEDDTRIERSIQTSECTYNKDVEVYMDAFREVTRLYFREQYQGFIDRSYKCDALPGGGHCSFNRRNPRSDAIFYYGGYTKLKYKRLFDNQIVVVFTLESENGENCHFPSPDKYDIKVSYRRDSTLPVPFLCEGNLALRIAEMGQPDVPVGREKLAAGFISNCGFKWRNKYITELMKDIHIDQWGKCLKNTPGEFWKTRQGPFEQEKLNFLNKNPYKFLIAFENGVEEDYITEKIYHAYLTRSIPIFYGDKAVFDLVPANTSLIYANNYTPKELAELIKRIDSNDTLYSEYFKNWDLNKMRKLHDQYCSDYFICAICKKVWETLYHRKCDSQATG